MWVVWLILMLLCGMMGFLVGFAYGQERRDE